METSLEPVVSSRPLRFNLKSLLLVTAAVGVILTPAHWFGVAYLVSVAFSAILVICCERAYRHKTGGATLGLAFFGTVVGFPLIPVFFGHAFLNLILCTVLVLIQVRPRMFAIATTSLAIGLYGLVIWSGVEKVRELTALKEKHPFVSLTERLAFEHDSMPAKSTTQAMLPLTPVVADHLTAQEENQNYSRYYNRAWALQQLHENINMYFARAAGFGVSRMANVYPRLVELEPRHRFVPPVPLDVASPNPSTADFYSVHRTALFDFLDSGRMGYVRSRREVAGFEPHGFSSLADQLSASGDVARYWQVLRLELVSLLRHDEPRVYVAESLPPMDQLAEVPHRALNEFEASALPKLETAEDLVIDQQPGRIQMLGAVRAANNCLECHEATRGKLLGAFSYEITPLTQAVLDAD